MESARQCAERRGVGDIMQFEGFVEQIAAFLGNRELFGLPSTQSEAFPLYLWEAMAMRILVLVTNIPDVDETAG